MKSKPGAIFLVSALALVLLASCKSSPESATPSPIEITDHLGKVVQLETIPQRIISLAPSNTEILFALGLEDKLIAVTDYCKYPPEAETKPSIGGFSNPNIEQIIALAPDLVLASSAGADTFQAQLEDKGVKVVSLDPKTIDQTLESITLTGKVTGKEAEARQMVADLDKQIKAITDRTAALPESGRPKVFYPVWHDPLMAGGLGTMHHEMIVTAGGIDIAADLDGYAVISIEVVLQENPDILIAGTHGDAATLMLDFLQNDPSLANTTARQTNSIYSIDDGPVRQPGPRVAEGLEMIAEIIHPELFK
jgi:iron complex transport system substrate-binding protein